MKTLPQLLYTSSMLMFCLTTEATVVTVGLGTDCDYNLLTGDSLQDAIDLTEIHEIRLHTNALYTSINIHRPIKILGGFDNCTTAAQGIISSSTDILANINGQDTDRVITINSTALAGDVILENLSISNGFAGTELSSDNGGGILIPYTNITNVKIISSVIKDNTAISGGGIYMIGNTTTNDLILTDTKIHNNQAINTGTGGSNNGGGGILTDSVDIHIEGNSGLFNNHTDTQLGLASGGAIAAYDSTITVIGGADLPEVGFFQNTAQYRGGALYLSGTDLTLIGNQTNINGTLKGNIDAPLKFSLNQSIDNYGGAIFAEGGSIQATDVLFSLNAAKIAGGAIGMIASELTMGSTPGQCWQDQACNVFTLNAAEFGGAIWSNLATDISVKHAIFNDNAANTGSSLTIGNGSTALLEAVVIINEGQSNTVLSNNNILFLADAAMTVNFSTIIENSNNESVFNSLGAASAMQVSNSIIYNSSIPQMIAADNEGTIAYSCILANSVENGAINIGATNYSNLFVDVAGFNLRLREHAYAIDFCDDLTTPPTANDLQNYARGYDDPTEGDIFGVFDAGANEYFIDLIFADSFDP